MPEGLNLQSELQELDMRKNRFSVIMFLFIVLSAVSVSGQNIEQKITRLFSFDPHPMVAEFSEPVPYKGEFLKHEVLFHETWKNSGGKDYLQSIHFTLNVVQAGKTIASASTTPFTTGKLKKAQQIAETSIGTTQLTVTVEDFSKSGPGIAELTLTFKLSCPEVKIEKAEAKVANSKTSTALDLCRKLAERASQIPAANAGARLSLYKKALAAAPTAVSSPEAAEFHASIGKLIADIEQKGSAKPESVATASPVEESQTPATTSPSTTASITPELSAPATRSTGAVASEATALYRQAQSLFAQDKGPEAREALRRAIEISPDYRDALILLGDNAYSNRKYAKAREAFEKVISLDETDADSLLKFFKAAYYLGEGSEAVLKLAAAKDRRPDDLRLKMAFAEASFQLGDLINAEAVCIEILNVNAGHSQARDLLERVRKHLK